MSENRPQPEIDGIDADQIVWAASDGAVRILASRPLLEEIRAAAYRARFGSRRAGVEIGGVLYGRRSPAGVELQGWTSIECGWSFGPSFRLTSREQGTLVCLLDGLTERLRSEGNEVLARRAIEQSVQTARESNHRDLLWRALEAQADLEQAAGGLLRARHFREEALSLLEAMAASLPRDLREVYWNDPRRRRLRAATQAGDAAAAGHLSPLSAPLSRDVTGSISTWLSNPIDQRLAKILEINAELAGDWGRNGADLDAKRALASIGVGRRGVLAAWAVDIGFELSAIANTDAGGVQLAIAKIA